MFYDQPSTAVAGGRPTAVSTTVLSLFLGGNTPKQWSPTVVIEIMFKTKQTPKACFCFSCLWRCRSNTAAGGDGTVVPKQILKSFRRNASKQTYAIPAGGSSLLYMFWVLGCLWPFLWLCNVLLHDGLDYNRRYYPSLLPSIIEVAANGHSLAPTVDSSCHRWSSFSPLSCHCGSCCGGVVAMAILCCSGSC